MLSIRVQFKGVTLALVLVSGCLVGAYAVASSNPVAPRYSIEIQKSKQLLLVKDGNDIARRFRVSLGRGGHGDKHRNGDKKTPVGVYRVADFHGNSPFAFFMQLNYPNIKDAFRGLRDELISKRDFERIINALRNGSLPPQNTALGGAIGIHGIGAITREKLRIHESSNWTEGCIALKNSEIAELRNYVQIGTRVEIAE